MVSRFGNKHFPYEPIEYTDIKWILLKMSKDFAFRFLLVIIKVIYVGELYVLDYLQCRLELGPMPVF